MTCPECYSDGTHEDNCPFAWDGAEDEELKRRECHYKCFD
jgi:hypothetical protein